MVAASLSSNLVMAVLTQNDTRTVNRLMPRIVCQRPAVRVLEKPRRDLGLDANVVQDHQLAHLSASDPGLMDRIRPAVDLLSAARPSLRTGDVRSVWQ
jgi:hypothetical protein